MFGFGLVSRRRAYQARSSKLRDRHVRERAIKRRLICPTVESIIASDPSRRVYDNTG